jgi:hypothetical protein
MTFRATAAVLAASLLASACVVVPVTTTSFDPDCRVVTYHMELKMVELVKIQACSSNGCEIEVLAGLGVTAVSTIVSGSIVVIGNVAYWAEHRASCPVLAPEPAASASA